jgi:hypothetical protein
MFVVKDIQETKSVVSKRQYQAPQLIHYGTLTALTQTGSGDMPENATDCANNFVISGKSCE